MQRYPDACHDQKLKRKDLPKKFLYVLLFILSSFFLFPSHAHNRLLNQDSEWVPLSSTSPSSVISDANHYVNGDVISLTNATFDQVYDGRPWLVDLYVFM